MGTDSWGTCGSSYAGWRYNEMIDVDNKLRYNLSGEIGIVNGLNICAKSKSYLPIRKDDSSELLRRGNHRAMHAPVVLQSRRCRRSQFQQLQKVGPLSLEIQKMRPVP
jgi:hypothetical protein